MPMSTEKTARTFTTVMMMKFQSMKSISVPANSSQFVQPTPSGRSLTRPPAHQFGPCCDRHRVGFFIGDWAVLGEFFGLRLGLAFRFGGEQPLNKLAALFL